MVMEAVYSNTTVPNLIQHCVSSTMNTGFRVYFLLLTHAITVASHGGYSPRLKDSPLTPVNAAADDDLEDSPLQQRLIERQYFGVQGELFCGTNNTGVRGFRVDNAKVEVWDHYNCEFYYPTLITVVAPGAPHGFRPSRPPSTHYLLLHWLLLVIVQLSHPHGNQHETLHRHHTHMRCDRRLPDPPLHTLLRPTRRDCRRLEICEA